MILYKVVTINRKSCTATNKYSISYNIGEIAERIPGTLGIFVFKSLYDAREFIGYADDLMIISVRSIGKIKTPKEICKIYAFDPDQNLDGFYNNKNEFRVTIPPKGTICCDAVRVID